MKLQHRIPLSFLLAIASSAAGVFILSLIVALVIAAKGRPMQQVLIAFAAASSIAYLLAGVLLFMRRNIGRFVLSADLLATCVLLALSMRLAWNPKDQPFSIFLLSVLCLTTCISLVGALLTNHEALIGELTAATERRSARNQGAI